MADVVIISVAQFHHKRLDVEATLSSRVQLQLSTVSLNVKLVLLNIVIKRTDTSWQSLRQCEAFLKSWLWCWHIRSVWFFDIWKCNKNWLMTSPIRRQDELRTLTSFCRITTPHFPSHFRLTVNSIFSPVADEKKRKVVKHTQDYYRTFHNLAKKSLLVICGAISIFKTTSVQLRNWQNCLRTSHSLIGKPDGAMSWGSWFGPHLVWDTHHWPVCRTPIALHYTFSALTDRK